MNKKEKDYIGRVVSLGCVVCNKYYGVFSHALAHHATGIEYRCCGKKALNFNVIPLCYNHHVNGSVEHPAIHSHPEEFERRFGTQGDLLKLTNDLL